MPFLTEDAVRAYADRIAPTASRQRTIIADSNSRVRLDERTGASRGHDIFLSHAHADLKLIAGLVDLIRASGKTVYVDFEDGDMPKATSGLTAVRLREKIDACRNFVLAATNTAIDRKWVNWEIGLADGLKGRRNVLILPLADSRGTWNGNEYLQTYPHIDYVNNSLVIRYPGSPSAPTPLTSI